MICQFCRSLVGQPRRQRFVSIHNRTIHNGLQARFSRTVLQRSKSTNAAPRKVEVQRNPSINATGPEGTPVTAQEAAAGVADAQKHCNAIINSDGIPSEADTANAMSACIAAIHRLVQHTKLTRGGTSSSPLSLDASDAASPASIGKTADLLSNLMYALLTHPTVFITPRLLNAYVSAQKLLRRPSTLPDIFDLYATKPAPVPGSSPPRYRTQNPRAAAAAVPRAVASAALDAAIAARDLDAALGVISTTFRAPAFQRAKLLTRAAPPLVAAVLAPAAAFALAGQLSAAQTTMEPATATATAFAGILTYVACTATIGYVAATTSNDQMDRVTWASGMPLRERWLREEERAAVDRVAGAWGLKDVHKRGEEEGEDWEFLREWIGVRGMVLDRVDLMDGME